jgi:sec-independent protein translocase protein TatA
VFDVSPVHLILLAAIALIVFGPRRLPEMARNLGRGVREFKSAVAMDDRSDRAQQPGTVTAAPSAAAPVVATPPTAALSTLAHDPDVEGFVRSGDDQPARPAE